MNKTMKHINQNKLFSVFTPTYNRANVLHRVYDTLKKQTFKDFEWIIIDDGSTDNTLEIVDTWKAQSDFPIIYEWQKNGHKKTAFNRALKIASGKLFLSADSDDELTPETLDIFQSEYFKIPEQDRGIFVGVCGLCSYPDNTIVGEKFPEDMVDCSNLDMLYKYKVEGEKYGFNRTDVLKKYPFPEHLEGYVSERVVWDTIGLEYKTRFINKVVRIYYQDGDNQITRLKKFSPGQRYTAAYSTSVELDCAMPKWFLYSPIKLILRSARWTFFVLHAKKISKEIIPKKTSSIVLIFLTIPFGVMAYLLWWTINLQKNITQRFRFSLNSFK
jgi:glycosyltransferase involved in cell wall biosynthesis